MTNQVTFRSTSSSLYCTPAPPLISKLSIFILGFGLEVSLTVEGPDTLPRLTACAVPSACCEVNCALRVERVHKYTPPLELQSQGSQPNFTAKGGGAACNFCCNFQSHRHTSVLGVYKQNLKQFCKSHASCWTQRLCELKWQCCGHLEKDVIQGKLP